MKILRQESGMVLLLVLVVITLLAALVTELAFSTLVDLRLTETFRDSTKAYYLAKGGVRAGSSILQRDSNSYDAPGDPAELWSQGIAQYPVGDGVVSVRIIDLGGMINLNALVNTNGSNVNPTVKDRVKRLFDNLGINEGETLTAALIDWIDEDDRVYIDPDTNRATGAEASYYLQREKPVNCKNGPLESLEELQLVREFSAELVQRIAPYVTLYGNDKINVNSASAEVLMALSADPEITRDAAESIIARREKGKKPEAEIPKQLRAYIADFDGNLDHDQYNSSKYSYRLLFKKKLVNRPGQADKVIEFIDPNAELAQTIYKEYWVKKEVERKKYRPSDVVAIAKEKGFNNFRTNPEHVEMWKKEDAKNPAKGFGAEVAGAWFWYDSWIERVLKLCEQAGEEYK